MKRDNEITLVAIVPRKKDWKILREKHWYRIPVKSAPEIVTQLKYLAFYQPKIFGEEKWAVNYYTKIKELNIVKRIELLPDEPKHIRAMDDYYKITIEELRRLPHPIPSKRWRRIVFIPTSLSKLTKAKEINDLYHTSPIEEKLYKIMKKDKIMAERQLFVKEENKRYCLDFGIFCNEGKIDVECDGDAYHSSKDAHMRDRVRNNELASYGWLVLRFTGAEINKDAKGCVKKIKRTIKSLKGFKENSVTNE
jgi:very-short-patch-repair endonuclease